MARLNRIWQCNTISFTSKFKLHKSLVTSILLYGCETWTLLADSEERIQAFKTKCMRSFSASPTWSTTPMTGCRARSTSLWVQRNLFWQLSRDGNSHGEGMSHATTASPKPSFKALWKLGDPWSAEEMLDEQYQRMNIPCPCQNCSQWPPAEKTGRGFLLNHPSCTPDDLIIQGLNWI